MKGLGVDPHAVARHMGHKSIDTQKHYTETTQGMKANVYDALARGARRVSNCNDDRKKAARSVVDVDAESTPVSKKPHVSTLNTAEKEELEAYRREQDPERKELEERRRRRSMENKENQVPAPSLAGLPVNPYSILYPYGYPPYPPPGIPPYHPPFPPGQIPSQLPPPAHAYSPPPPAHAYPQQPPANNDGAEEKTPLTSNNHHGGYQNGWNQFYGGGGYGR
ncbi:unknown protein [Seminavis robusta]|uniref:Uncharacterized protein n=1 Tax=Seminavis robusta TaxID=568900 RepID=A0A9N8F3H0_9STRA|nr:unknown protein [Seminavis robusta]|eukprot:Sro4699_g354490.1 n/a (222) ;mRNA; r:217-882